MIRSLNMTLRVGGITLLSYAMTNLGLLSLFRQTRSACSKPRLLAGLTALSDFFFGGGGAVGRKLGPDSQ